MRRFVLRLIALGSLFFTGSFAQAQSTLDALEQELNEAKQQHQDATSQSMTSFFSQLDAAMAGPDAAVALYEQAGGMPPDPMPVVTQHETESESEKEARLAVDQANLTRLGTVLQLHCGLMHFAALFVIRPDQKGLQDDWVAWLQKAAQIYPQLALPAVSAVQSPVPHKKKWDKSADGPPIPPPPPPPYNPADLKAKTMHDSIISQYLGFKSWKDKEQGTWTVQDLPKLFRANVLEPLRATPTQATLAAWDAFIAMANADEIDNDKWNQVVYPPLQFDRACDDYAVAPGTEKLEGLVNLIKANPTAPQADDWIARVHQLVDAYRVRHGGAPASSSSALTTPTAPTGNPNVTVTTEQQGDMTIVTTHTNSAPITNAPPAP
jgi:hypothetical protein